MNKPMTAREFVANSDRCPRCHSEAVEWDEITVEGTNTIQEGSCQDCDARFYTLSRMVGYMWLDRDNANLQVHDGGMAELLSAAERVVSNWANGDLALAVRELDRAVREVKER